MAVILARNLASQTDNLFEEIRVMNKTTGTPLASLILKVDLNAKKEPISFSLDAQPHETEAAQALISTLLSANSAPQNASIALTAQIPPLPKPSKNFQDLIDEYFVKATTKASTKANYKSKLQFAKKYFGDNFDLLNANQIDIVNFSEHVKSQIKNRTTQGLYIQIVVTFANWHRRRHGLSDLNSKSLIPIRQTPEHEDREELTLNDMRVIMTNAFVYSRKQPYKWWSTIAVAFTGCRIEELCQVNLRTDLIHDIENNIWYFKIDERPDSDGSNKKSLKKLTSWRHLPIHSVLVKHGFIDYLKTQIQKGASRPFELDWKPRIVEKDNINKWSQYASKWDGRELNKLSENRLIARGDKTYFHSMRHTIAKLMQNAAVPSEISEAIAGRNSGQGEQSRYAKIHNNHVLLSREGIEKALIPLVEILESVISNYS